MQMSKRQRLLFFSVVCAFVAVSWVRVATAPAQEKAKEKADRTETVTLQYRVARDAVAPSRFVAVIDKGISAPLDIRWDLPSGQEKKKGDFDVLIKKLEERQINGVEFECRGEWLKGGGMLRVTTVPQLTEIGKKRIAEHAR